MRKNVLVAMVIGLVSIGLVGCNSDNVSDESYNESNSSEAEKIISDKDYWSCLKKTLTLDDYRVDILFQDENKSKYNWKDIMLVNTYEDKKYVSMLGDVSHEAGSLNSTYDERVAQIKEDYGFDVDESGLYVIGMYSDDEFVTISDETSTYLKKELGGDDYYDAFYRPLISGDISSLLNNRMNYMWIDCNIPSDLLISGLKNVMEAYELGENLKFVNSYKKTDTELIISLQEKGFLEWTTNNVEGFKDYEILLNNNLIKDKHEVKLSIELSGDYVSRFELSFDVLGCNDVAFILDFTESNFMESKNVAETFKKSVEETVVNDWKYSLNKHIEFREKTNSIYNMEYKYAFDVNDYNTLFEYAKNQDLVSVIVYEFDGYSYKNKPEDIIYGTEADYENAYTIEELKKLIED